MDNERVETGPHYSTAASGSVLEAAASSSIALTPAGEAVNGAVLVSHCISDGDRDAVKEAS